MPLSNPPVSCGESLKALSQSRLVGKWQKHAPPGHRLDRGSRGSQGVDRYPDQASAIVLMSIEVPVVAYRLAPQPSMRIVKRIDEAVRRFAWQLGTVAAAGGGVYLVVRGSIQLAP